MLENKPIDSKDIEPRVKVLAPGVLCVRALAHPTPETIEETAKELMRLSETWDHISLVLEIDYLLVPNSELRHKLSEHILKAKKRIDHIAIVTQQNVFLRVAIKFITQLTGFKRVSFHRTRESALKHVLKDFPIRPLV